MSDSIFDLLAKQLRTGSIEGALDRLVEELRRTRAYHDLFDALLMRSRAKLGLPIAKASRLEDIPEPTRTQVEAAYLAACREVGQLLLAENKLREAWMYLRPAQEHAAMKQALETITVDEENIDTLIEIALQEGVCPSLGFKLLLQQYGTCDAITTFESQMNRFPLSEQQAAAAMLVQNMHEELSGAVRAEIQQREGKAPSEISLIELVADRDWLFLNGNYHVDTTHLAAIVRFAKICTEENSLRQALDLTEYGRRLDPQYQFEGDEPFTQIYLHHAMFFQALLGEKIDEALSYFRDRAEEVSIAAHGSEAAETYIGLLSRLGRHQNALAEMQRLLAPGVRRLGIAGSLLELSRAAQDFSGLLENCRAGSDLVGYVTGILSEMGQ